MKKKKETLVYIPMAVDVFGTKYKVHLVKDPDTWMYENSAEGYCNFDNKVIYVRKCDRSIRIYRHELIHCYLYESGLRNLASNENIVEILTEIFERICENGGNKYDVQGKL